MRQIIFIGYMGLLVLFANSCKQEVPGPIENDGVAPAQVTGITVENLNGAAEISFNVPADPDLLYVKAVYITKKGERRETKVSKSNRSVLVVGFADTDPYTVSLYAVDKGENMSAPVNVTVNPKDPPKDLVRATLSAIPDFGGMNVSYENVKAADVAIIVLTNNDLGEFLPVITYNTKLKKSVFAVRNLKAKEARFGIYVRDRWGNLSDTLYFNLTPYYEERLDRTKMKALVLPTDAGLGYGGSMANLFDDKRGDDSFYHSDDAARMPQWFTFDMGITAKITRLTYFMRMNAYYALHTPRDMEIWGSNNPAPDGSFNNWTLLATHTQIKPSGLPLGQLSLADNEAGRAGESISVAHDLPKVRYIRFKTTRNWSSGTYVNFNELEVWGDPR